MVDRLGAGRIRSGENRKKIYVDDSLVDCWVQCALARPREVAYKREERGGGNNHTWVIVLFTLKIIFIYTSIF